MTIPLNKTQNTAYRVTGFMQTVQIDDKLDARFLMGIDINQKDVFGNTALHWAVHHGNLHNIKILMRHGSSLETSKGMNALFCAVLYNQIDVLSFFLEKGFDPSMEYNGLTLLKYAQRLKRTEMVDFLAHKE